MLPPSGRNLIWLLLLATLLGVGCQSPFPSGKSNKFGNRGLFGLAGKKDGDSPLDGDSLDPMGERNGNRLLLHDLSPSQIGTTMKVKGFAKPNEKEAEQAFAEGQQLYEEAGTNLPSDPELAHKLYEQAANKFRLASDRWPDSALEQDALFYEGEADFFANRYVQANRAFEKLIAQYSGSRYLDKAEARRFSIAQYWLQLSRKGGMTKFKIGDPQRPAFNLASESRRIFHRIRLDDPSGKLADDATMALGNAYFEAKMYQDAADSYEDLRITYPGSQHAFHAHLFELKSRMNSYYGKSYDQEPLVKADELLKLIEQQFPKECADEREYLASEATTVRNLLAERDFSLGQYYEKKGENLAASMIYKDVTRNYDDTDVAEDSKEKLLVLGDKPSEPPQRAQWLIDMLPQSEANKPLIASGDKESIFR